MDKFGKRIHQVRIPEAVVFLKKPKETTIWVRIQENHSFVKGRRVKIKMILRQYDDKTNYNNSLLISLYLILNAIVHFFQDFY
jgi:hypothetical protein